MARVVSGLNDTQIKNFKAKEKDYKKSDGKGLYLLVKSNGSKIWRFKYNKPYTSKETTASFGSYPEIGLKQAREKREEYRALLAQNIDPLQHKEQQKRQEQQKLLNTFGSIAEHWKAYKSTTDIKPLTLEKYWGIIKLYLLPELANYPITEISPIIVKPVLEIPYNQRKAEMFRKSIKLLNAILNYAVNSLYVIPSNPCLKITTAFEPLERGTNPAIKPEELPEFLDRLENSDIDLLTKYLIQWELLTMVRPNEAVTAEWSEIDLDKRLWTIPYEKMKKTKSNKDRPHLVPLSLQAMQLLDRIKRLGRNSPFVFPSTRGNTGHLSNQTANKAIRDNMGYDGKQTAHGMRKIASTYLHEQCVMPDVVEMCLAHDIKGIRGTYNNAEYLAHRKKALKQWGDYVAKCKLKANTSHLKLIA